MKRSTKIFGWLMAGCLLFLGGHAMISGYFIGRFASGILHGVTAYLVGAALFGIGFYFVYLLRTGGSWTDEK